MQIEKAIEKLKLCISMSLHGGKQTIVNIEDLDTVLNHIEKLEAESKNVVSRKKYRQTKKTLKGQINKLNAVIDKMANAMIWKNKINIQCRPLKAGEYIDCTENVKKHFYKKGKII